MRCLIYLADAVVLLIIFFSILDMVSYEIKVREDYYYIIACDIAKMAEGKELNDTDINFILNFLPKNSYFEISSKDFNFKREGENRTIYSCQIEGTVVRIGI